MIVCHRHYRVAALPVVEAPLALPAHDAAGMAEAAERDLRRRLAAGQVPEVGLIAPERCVRSDVGRDGTLTGPCWAWSRASEPMAHTWIHSPQVTGILSVDLWGPDPMDPTYTEAGSVRVMGGRLLSLELAPWLAPVADQLRRRYGAHISTRPGPDRPPPEVSVAPPWVRRAALAPSAAQWVLQTAVEALRARRPAPTRPGRPVLVPLPGAVANASVPLLRDVAEHFALPLENGTTAVAFYPPGSGFPTSTAARATEPATLDRTVAWTLLLTTGFTGGALHVNGEHVPAAVGDAVAFTARTPHSVATVTSGLRAAWLGFGEVVR